jgi:quercetin dioxygenase-like cupin family protein
MKMIDYTNVQSRSFEGEAVKGVTGRIAIGRADGALNFCMRVFEVAPGGHTPRHAHEWEHEIFVHRGTGEVFDGGNWNEIGAGSVLFIPGNEIHQIRNQGQETLVFVCLIPAGPPEL